MEKFFNAIQATLEGLHDRWQDEKQFEDINDYQIPFEPQAKINEVTITKMLKRPFGFKCTHKGKKYKVFCNKYECGWDTI